MDPVMSVDESGNGTVVIYRYGKSWTISVVGWIGQPLPYQPPENPMNRIAQSELNRLWDGDWTREDVTRSFTKRS